MSPDDPLPPETPVASTAAEAPDVPPIAVVQEESTPLVSRRRLWGETLAVLLIFILPVLFDAVAWLFWPGTGAPRTFVHSELRLLAYNVQAIALCAFIVRLSSEPSANFGLHRRLTFLDVAFAVLLVGAGNGTMQMVGDLMGEDYWYVYAAEFKGYAPKPTRTEWLLIVVAAIVNGFAEELVFRGVLFTRIERLSGSASTSLLATSALFGACHAFYGPTGVAQMMALSFLYGLMFMWTRRLWPVALAHMHADLLPTVYAYFP